MKGAGVGGGIALGEVVVECRQPSFVYFIKNVAVAFAYECLDMFEGTFISEAC